VLHIRLLNSQKKQGAGSDQMHHKRKLTESEANRKTEKGKRKLGRKQVSRVGESTSSANFATPPPKKATLEAVPSRNISKCTKKAKKQQLDC
jgi:hypothetical protein